MKEFILKKLKITLIAYGSIGLLISFFGLFVEYILNSQVQMFSTERLVSRFFQIQGFFLLIGLSALIQVSISHYLFLRKHQKYIERTYKPYKKSRKRW